MGLPKFKLFHYSRWTDEIFRIVKYEKIKFGKIWGYQNKGIPLKQGRQNSKFYNLR